MLLVELASRRAALAAAALVLAPSPPIWALAPPRGRIEPLVPILQGRILLAELAATASAPPEQRSAVQWSSVLTSLLFLATAATLAPV